MHHNDSEACREVLRRVQRGELLAALDPVVLGELAYMLVKPTFAPQGAPARTREQVAHHLLGVLAWSGIDMDDKDLAASALSLWEAGQSDDLVDCYLQARSRANGERVCSVKLRHFPDGVHPADLIGMARPGSMARPPSHPDP